MTTVSYTHLIGLDPGYRTGEEGELKLLKEDVMKELLENYYIKDDKKFKYFICLLYTSRCV